MAHADNTITTPESLLQQSRMQNARSTPEFQAALASYANGGSGNTSGYNLGQAQLGQVTPGDVNRGVGSGVQQSFGMGADQQQAFKNALATDPTTMGVLASNQIMQDPTLGKIYGKGGEFDKSLGQLDSDRSNSASQLGRINNLQDQGYQLNSNDESLYGQAAGNIARQYGNQGNQAAASLAARGLGNSGAAGATFSGLQGNQNEMLAQAQQQIMQQRFQNTQQQLGQMQSLYGQLNSKTGQDQNYANQQTQDYGNIKQNNMTTNLAGVQTQNQAQNSNITNNQNQQGLYQNEENEKAAQTNAGINMGINGLVGLGKTAASIATGGAAAAAG